jgi:adenylate kinase
MSEKILNFVLIGRSGSGKGTQAEFLKQEFSNLHHIITGDLFRKLSKSETDTSHHIKKILAAGGLPFDYLAITLWMHEIAFNIKEDQGILADGFPRRLNEAKILDDFLSFLERKENTKILYIDVPEKEAFNRLTKRRICKQCKKIIPYIEPYKNWEKCEACGGELMTRSDDNPIAIQSRLDYFNDRVVPALDYYKEQDRLIVINGELSPSEVFEDIKKKIK